MVFKVSEYPFKQNRSMLKNITVLLYTYFFNISFIVPRPTFFNICNFPFLHSPNIQLTTVPTLWAPAPTELQFSVTFFHWYTANEETNKTVPAIFSLSNIFWIISFSLFSWKIHFQNSSNYCHEKWTTHY